jgi:hypothetical protein
MTKSKSEEPGAPKLVDRATFQGELDALRLREKAHTHEGDAIAAARRRLPMVEVDPTIKLIGANGPVALLDVFEGRRQLIAYYFMWHTGRLATRRHYGYPARRWTSQSTVVAPEGRAFRRPRYLRAARSGLKFQTRALPLIVAMELTVPARGTKLADRLSADMAELCLGRRARRKRRVLFACNQCDLGCGTGLPMGRGRSAEFFSAIRVVHFSRAVGVLLARFRGISGTYMSCPHLNPW